MSKKPAHCQPGRTGFPRRALLRFRMQQTVFPLQQFYLLLSPISAIIGSVVCNAVCRKYGLAVTEGVTLSGVRKDEDCKRIKTLETPGKPGAEGASV